MRSNVMMNQNVALSIRSVIFHRTSQLILSNINLNLHAQQSCLITGANGSGKSTLLKIIAGLVISYDGEICWNNVNIQKNFHHYQKDLHFVSHANGIKLGLTVDENLKLMQYICGAKNNIRTDDILTALGLSDKKNCYAKFLSAGFKKKLALARLFLFPKKLWILDEPFSSLDAQSQIFFIDQINKHLLHHGILILSSHQHFFPTTYTINLTSP